MERATGLLSPAKSFYVHVLRLLLPFTVGVVVLYSLLVQFAVNQTEDHIIHRYLELEFERIVQQANAEPQSVRLTNSAFLTTYLNTDAKLPENYDDLNAGVHELNDGRSHVLVGDVEKIERRIYIVFDENKLSNIEFYESALDSGLVALGLILLLVTGWVVAALIAKRLASPLESLVQDLQQGWRSDAPLSGSDRCDEIGSLSRSFEAYSKKLDEVLEREKSFTRHASHEMRTPIGVIKNALSVIQLPSISTGKRDKNLQRIDCACKDLEQMTNVFLMLGRPAGGIPLENASVPLMVKAVLNRFEYQIAQQRFDVALEGDDAANIETNVDLFKVLVANLILNAIHHGRDAIKILYGDGFIEVTNPLSSKKDRHDNHGYGLEIVERICIALGWRFQRYHNNGIYSAKINFSPN